MPHKRNNRLSNDAHVLDHRYAARYHETAQPLRMRDRVFSWTAGWRDRGLISVSTNDVHRAAESAKDGLSAIPTTRWLTRNAKSCLEAMEWEYLDGESRAARYAYDLDKADRNIRRLKAELLELRADLARDDARPKPELLSITRSKAEHNVDDAVILGRHMKAHNARVALTTSRANSTVGSLRELEEQAADLSSIVQKAFSIAVTRARGTHAWYERRASIYLRALTRRHPEGAKLQVILGGTDTIPTPAWIFGECPWVPREYLSSTQTPTEMEPTLS